MPIAQKSVGLKNLVLLKGWNKKESRRNVTLLSNCDPVMYKAFRVLKIYSGAVLLT